MESADAEGLNQTILRQVQAFVRLTPSLLVGSGFSCSYGLPLMSELGSHLVSRMSEELASPEALRLWNVNVAAITADLESGLNKIASGAQGREEIIPLLRKLTAEFINARMTLAADQILKNPSPATHAPARLLKKLYTGAPENGNGIHIISTNYDTLVELFCDLAGLPIDTGFEGLAHRKLRTGSLFKISYMVAVTNQRRSSPLSYRPEKMVRLIKPHGSITWVMTNSGPMEVLGGKVAGTAAIVVPGPSKYEDAVTDMLFDKMRTEMNVTFSQTRALLAIGYGFNDRHLQGIIENRLKDRMPLIILTKKLTEAATSLIGKYPHILAFCEDSKGAVLLFDSYRYSFSEPIWQLDSFLKYFLE